MIQLPITYSQTDPRWSNFLLGDNTLSKFNLYNYGCLITNIATLSVYYGYQVNPMHINELIKQKKGFVAGTGNYIWGSITKLFSDITEKKTDTPGYLTNAQMAEIKTALDNGFPVMLNIDYNPKTVPLDFHYVLALGYNPADENDFTIVDPIGGQIKSLKNYLGWFQPSARKTIQQYAVYMGPKPKITENAILVRIEDNERNIMKASQYDEICSHLQFDSNTMKSKDIIKLFEDMASGLKTLNDKQKTTEKDLYNALKDMQTMEQKIKELENAAVAAVQPLKTDPMPEFKIPTPVKPPVSYTDIQVQRESLLGKILSFFQTTAEEYAKLKRK